ncbi:hypothetical protein FDB88_11915 [Clostridium sporogenes]|uniref:hypothetical protein n=1 Tax=Clostridium sporogenes TaxID=1509 RepID=UPI0013D1DCD2|nr:hypothetical protein [Clostridium sporogenes]NFM17893.1 hypothetical protein [Clostridium sporogenes]
MAIYVGGDRTTLEYNFFAKVAGSITECPMKCYWARAKDLLLPTDIRWKEFNQENYDRIKNQDNISALMDATIVGEKPQFLIELDLNGLCNNLYAGSNAILEQNVKSIQLSAVVRGKGANGEVLGYLSKHYLYRHDTSQYVEWGENTTSSLVTSSNEVTMVGASTGYITQDNKIYMLLVANYPANSTILSVLYLDYMSIGLKLIRQPDVVPPIDVNLKDEWSILIKGFSPSWDNNNAPNPYPRVLEIKDKLIVSYRQDSKIFYFQDMGTNILTPLPQFTFKKFQNINFILTQNKHKKITFYAYENAGTLKKNSAQGNAVTGSNNLYILESVGNARNGDAFIDNIQMLNRSVTDQEAEIILKNKNTIDLNNIYYNQLANIYQNPSMCPSFNNSQWYIHPNATVNPDGSILTLVATANYQGSSIILPILPYNRYKINVEIEDFNNLAHIAITQRYNNTNISTARVFDNSGNYDGEFITQDKINTLVIACQNTGIGTFKFKNLKLKRLD